MTTRMSDPRELFLHELGDALYAERTLVKILPKLQEEASDRELALGFKEHLDETQQHVKNVEQAFELLGEKPTAEKCTGIEGIKKEHDDFVAEESPSQEVLDSFLTGAGARTEHYEIAAYEGLVTMAEAMGETEVVELLSENLEQEKTALEKLNDDREAARAGRRQAEDTRLTAPARPGADAPAPQPTTSRTRNGGNMTNVTDERAQMPAASEQVKERVQDAAEQAKGETRDQLRRQVNARSTQAGEQASSIAEAMRGTTEQLRSEGKDSAAKVIDGVADRSERLGGYLTQADDDRILRDVEDFARRQPWVFVGGSAVLGFLAARFMKASSSSRYQSRAGDPDSPSRAGVPAAPASSALASGGASAGGAPRGGGSGGREY